jgi:hypothetical protein
MPFSGIKPGSKLEHDIDDCVASIRGDNPGMGKSQAIAICRSRLEKMSEEKEHIIQEEKGGMSESFHPARDDEHEKRGDGFINPGATSFAELDEVEAAEEAANMIRKRTSQFNGLIDNIMMDPDVEDKANAINDLANEFGVMAGAAMERKERWQPLTDAVIKAIKPLFGKKGEGEIESPPETDPAKETENKNSFMVYKEADGGYRWLAIYSNKFRDRDNPPEIISEASHLNFVKQVNSGELPFPELWLWHVEGSRWGVADFVGWDDTGFSIASGTVDKGKEWVADSLEGDLLTSHGMPKDSIQRDPADSTIITGHITKEISPLPETVAANEFTGFSILGSEVKQMALSEEDRAKLLALNVDPDRLEAQTEEKAKETEGLEYKEADQPEAAPATAEGDFVSRDEVKELVKSVAESTNQLVQVVGDLAERIKVLEANKLTIDKETIERTPAASLADLYKSVIGSEEAKVDGRSKLAKSGPEEAPVEESNSRLGGGLAGIIAQRNVEIERGGVQ